MFQVQYKLTIRCVSSVPPAKPYRIAKYFQTGLKQILNMFLYLVSQLSWDRIKYFNIENIAAITFKLFH